MITDSAGYFPLSEKNGLLYNIMVTGTSGGKPYGCPCWKVVSLMIKEFDVITNILPAEVHEGEIGLCVDACPMQLITVEF